jgi:hypothetical protein
MNVYELQGKTSSFLLFAILGKFNHELNSKKIFTWYIHVETVSSNDVQVGFSSDVILMNAIFR